MISQLLQFLFLAILGANLVDAKWLSVIPNAPVRSISKVFGIPTWLSHIEDYDDDAMNATTVFSVVCIAVSTVYALYYLAFIYVPTQARGRQSIGPFNTLVMLYLIATFFATFSFSVMSVGRIWASFGVFHNLFEIALLSHIMFRQKSIMQRRFVATCFIYLLLTMFIVIIAPWPLDALFFKFQGLATDFSLSIDLGRLYYHNKSIHRKASVGTMIPSSDDEEDSDEYTKECDLLIQQLQQQQVEQEKQMDADPKKVMSMMVPVHKNISVLYTAALLHAVGNALVTFSNHFYLWIIFQFIYAISFPMYAYYCIAEPNASRVSFYKVDYAKEALVMVMGATLAGVSIAVGIYNSGIKL
ncbi:hypothetical protein INT47_005074 [Mucor saturninus]|uniref:Uncharacterized protein n=1 Tax=Mucor saturninus TaxID=64648 RepID=A0A8H7UX80_9FUNG|nr:hypothetical protein INT47_005074 [Mucor saturninus]